MSNHRKSSNYYVQKQEGYKSMPELREGDWICLTCNNLNFSFRTICNRCKVQTRDTNYPQFYNFIVTTPFMLNMVVGEVESFVFEQNKQNRPFQSALLLTPTKNDENNDEGMPYKSPCSLPSVSPLLKKFNSSQLVQCSTKAKISSPLRNPLITKFQLDQQTLSPSETETDQEINCQISQLLSEIDLDM